MGPNDRTSTQMTWFGSPLSGWNEVRNSDGSYAGSNQQVTGGTQHYDASGNRSGFTTSDETRLDASGNPNPNHDPYK